MFRNKRKYYSLEEVLKDYDTEDYIVQKTEGLSRFYLKFDSCYSFFYWYQEIREKQRTFNEVIFSGKQKFKIDIDEYPDDIDRILDCIKDILFELGISNPNLIVYDIETSYHIVLSNYFFTSNIHCRYLADKISTKVNIDTVVYKKVQHFRVEESTKYGELRWKRRLGKKFDISSFTQGVISNIVDCEHADINIFPMPKKVSGGSNFDGTVPSGFIIRKRIGNMIVLNRTSSSYCELCRRVHDNENAFIVGSKFYCRRNL
jgi:hypothetical protein